MSTDNSDETARVLIQTLRQSKESDTLDLEKIALEAKTSETAARAILTRFLKISRAGLFPIRSTTRVQIAVEVARIGRLRESAKSLTWQEFESFGAECLSEAGFQTEKNVRVRGEGRSWQIDLVGYRGDLVLTIDCKHWSTSGYESRLEPPAEHQRTSTIHLLRTLIEKAGDLGKNLQGLAVILTLLDPPARLLGKAALVSVEQFPGFLSAVSPYDPTLPLITTLNLVENPMS